jgi:hypothetical protein
MMIISTNSFYQYLNNLFLFNHQEVIRQTPEYVKDEELCFITNIQLFNELSIFLNGCFEVYHILIKWVDDMILKREEFNQLI